MYNDYSPLYDVALSRDYIPVTKFIERRFPEFYNERETFSSLYVEAYQEGFKIEGDDENIYRSLGQILLSEFAAVEENIAVVAPTSYGKSEMIIKKVQSNLDKKICILVPSKALLSQTKKLLLNNTVIRENFRKIITHPDMFQNEDEVFLAVLTQERLLRLLQKEPTLRIDLVLVDEAHNLLEDSERAHLLAQVLLILQKRKENFVANFYTPFLSDVNNLNIINHQTDITGRPIKEFMKIEKFYSFDVQSRTMCLYDQFVNKSFRIDIGESATSDIEFILANNTKKNIIYLNRPFDVEKFSRELAERREEIFLTEEIQKIITSISDLIHPDYNLINCIRKGIVYHHGGIPDVIRLYIEEIFSKHKEFEFIVTTSTLLEGVNIPAEKIFILTPEIGKGYLSAAQFRNLIGRVCRFNEVFNVQNGTLQMLEPEIYLIKGMYSPSNFSIQTFYNEKANSSIIIEDMVKNPLLENSDNTENLKEVLEYLENMEPGTSGLSEVISPRSEIGRLCFVNNVHDFNIIDNEDSLINNLNHYIQKGNEQINNAESLVVAVVQIFFEDISLVDKSENLARLKENEKARSFYSMFIDWRSRGAPYPLMIASFLDYWRRLEARGETLVFVGPRWGEETRGAGFKRLWVNLTSKNNERRVNLAIAKIKEEQEFVDFNIVKYLEIMNELNIINPDFYDQVKYGTSNKELICMLKNGFSMELSKLLISRSYRDHIDLSLETDFVGYTQQLIDILIQNEENDILIFEARSHI